MTEILQRAAKAVADYTGQRMPPSGDIVTCEGIARAVLQSIREPSIDAKLAGASAITLEMMEAKANYDAACACWPAMLGAMLAE